jgi:nucleotide-binding universal stress UspA family protein
VEAARALSVATALARDTENLEFVHVVGGDIPTAIADFARTHGSECIVIATHARGEVGRLLHGSAAERVLPLSRIPLVLVPPGVRPAGEIRTLLVPLDTSPGSKRALTFAARMASRHAARIELVTVVHGMPAYVRNPVPGVDLGPTFAPGVHFTRQAAVRKLELIKARLARRGISAGSHVVVGPVAAAIACAADDLDADLIVMSTRALSGAPRTVLGSIAAGVVRGAHRPVALVHRAP